LDSTKQDCQESIMVGTQSVGHLAVMALQVHAR